MKDTLQYDKKIANFEAAIRIVPDDAKAHHHLRVTYAKGGKLDLAIESYQAAIRINPDLDRPQLRRRLHSQQTKKGI